MALISFIFVIFLSFLAWRTHSQFGCYTGEKDIYCSCDVEDELISCTNVGLQHLPIFPKLNKLFVKQLYLLDNNISDPLTDKYINIFPNLELIDLSGNKLETVNVTKNVTIITSMWPLTSKFLIDTN